MTDLIKKGKLSYRDMHEERQCENTGRAACEGEGRGWGDISSNQRMTKIASKPPEARTERPFLHSPGRNQP